MSSDVSSRLRLPDPVLPTPRPVQETCNVPFLTLESSLRLGGSGRDGAGGVGTPFDIVGGGPTVAPPFPTSQTTVSPMADDRGHRVSERCREASESRGRGSDTDRVSVSASVYRTDHGSLLRSPTLRCHFLVRGLVRSLLLGREGLGLLSGWQ